MPGCACDGSWMTSRRSGTGAATRSNSPARLAPARTAGLAPSAGGTSTSAGTSVAPSTVPRSSTPPAAPLKYATNRWQAAPRVAPYTRRPQDETASAVIQLSSGSIGSDSSFTASGSARNWPSLTKPTPRARPVFRHGDLTLPSAPEPHGHRAGLPGRSRRDTHPVDPGRPREDLRQVQVTLRVACGARDVVVDPCVKRGTPASLAYCRHCPVVTVRQSDIERKVHAELREIRGAIKALQARIDYVLTDLHEYRKRESGGREDETQGYPEWINQGGASFRASGRRRPDRSG